MIIRERANDFVMITQHDHAQISGHCAEHWKNDFFEGLPMRESVELAIKEHDRGWVNPDKKPLWNDEKNSPFSFMDYPTMKKLSLYKNGIDEVEAIDAYACLLCSEHYIRFTSRNPDEAAQEFVRNERMRQERLKKKFAKFDDANFQFHYDLLAFCDNVSLYACLNEPGTTKEVEHRFFQKGLPIPKTFSFFDEDRLPIHWSDQQTIILKKLPFDRPIEIIIKQKVVAKEDISAQGIQDAFKNAPSETISVWIKGEDK